MNKRLIKEIEIEKVRKERISKINMPIKVATLNLCLGLKNKKFLVQKILDEHNIDILCMQETEVTKMLSHDELGIRNYSLEMEKNSVKSRVGFYIAKTVNFIRRQDLEGCDSNLVIIDIEGTLNTRLINVYRSFSPQNGVSQREKFRYQLSLINTAMKTLSCVLVGDFNLNYARKEDIFYSHARYFDDFEFILSNMNLIQLVEFPTWSRVINNVLHESIIDHIVA